MNFHWVTMHTQLNATFSFGCLDTPFFFSKGSFITILKYTGSVTPAIFVMPRQYFSSQAEAFETFHTGHKTLLYM